MMWSHSPQTAAWFGHWANPSFRFQLEQLLSCGFGAVEARDLIMDVFSPHRPAPP